jgi:hypothetical protein
MTTFDFTVTSVTVRDSGRNDRPIMIDIVGTIPVGINVVFSGFWIDCFTLWAIINPSPVRFITDPDCPLFAVEA